MRRAIVAVVILVAVSAFAQSVEPYLSNMKDALEPYGTVVGENCHSLKIELNGPWGYRAIPEGVDDSEPDELTWAILRVNTLRMYLDLSTLDDNVGNNPIYSMQNLRRHQKGGRYVPDSPSVFFSAAGSHGFTVRKVDLKKVESLPAGTFATESEMGAFTVERRGATILFVDQQHADEFQKALTNGISSCKQKADAARGQSGGTN